ncbi:helix-turn-helix transcriptional regulator [Oscillospiraceae bacterium N12]|uniref:Helix-turn-helix transcriptional regulator n=1 Tax=Jilunia laotingensis TaxID=2763675 RepID=A0A926F865_9BACT|nr:helix-turn-helix transcriptional regulator [Jilunia laotingensis]MBC8593872.1 helix-turn-helix transcriptional regulator [Jilunia laotingensis]
MNRIKDILKEKGITINELAETMGLNRVTLSTQINGTANITSYEKIATALDVPMWQLFASPAEVTKEAKGETCPYCGKPITIKTTIEKA